MIFFAMGFVFFLMAAKLHGLYKTRRETVRFENESLYRHTLPLETEDNPKPPLTTLPASDSTAPHKAVRTPNALPSQAAAEPSSQSDYSHALYYERLQLTIDNIIDGIITLNGDGVIESVNISAEKMFGYRSGEMLGLTLTHLFAEGHVPADIPSTLHESLMRESVGLRKDGTHFMMEYVLSGMVYDGEFHGLCTIRDISEFKQLKYRTKKLETILKRKQEEMKQLDKTIMARVADKTARLREANRELKAAYRELKKTEGRLIQKERWISIGQLSAGIAHEINNPLGFVENNMAALKLYVSKFKTMIDVYQSFIRKLESKSIFFEDIGRIREQENALKLAVITNDLDDLHSQTVEGIKRISTIVKSLKNFSAMERLSKDTPFNINEGVANTLSICRHELKELTVVTEYGHVPTIRCNPGKINQVFLNIIINAAQAIRTIADRRKGIVTLRTFAKDRFVYCAISDNGPGIPAQDIHKIFDPFFTTKDPNLGSGLGLSVSYDIVQKHGGELMVESTEGKGTIFTVKLPLVPYADMNAMI